MREVDNRGEEGGQDSRQQSCVQEGNQHSDLLNSLHMLEVTVHCYREANGSARIRRETRELAPASGVIQYESCLLLGVEERLSLVRHRPGGLTIWMKLSSGRLAFWPNMGGSVVGVMLDYHNHNNSIFNIACNHETIPQIKSVGASEVELYIIGHEMNLRKK